MLPGLISRRVVSITITTDSLDGLWKCPQRRRSDLKISPETNSGPFLSSNIRGVRSLLVSLWYGANNRQKFLDHAICGRSDTCSTRGSFVFMTRDVVPISASIHIVSVSRPDHSSTAKSYHARGRVYKYPSAFGSSSAGEGRLGGSPLLRQ